jgi:hypothetical protein
MAELEIFALNQKIEENREKDKRTSPEKKENPTSQRSCDLLNVDRRDGGSQK